MCFLSQVFVGSASEGVLEAGDRLLTINKRPTEGITHVEAQNIFRQSTTIIAMTTVMLIMLLLTRETKMTPRMGSHMLMFKSYSGLKLMKTFRL